MEIQRGMKSLMFDFELNKSVQPSDFTDDVNASKEIPVSSVTTKRIVEDLQR